MLKLTRFKFETYRLFETIDKYNYNYNCLYLASEAGGLSDVKLQQLVLALRNRAIHKCDLNHMCNTWGKY